MSTPKTANAGATPATPSSAVLRLLDQPVCAADLAAGAEAASRPAATHVSGTTGVLLFRLDNECLAIPARLLRRTTAYTRPLPIPNRSTGILRGLCNIRGELVLCADLRRLLGLPAHDNAETSGDTGADARRMVVIGPAGASWVFEVDALIGVERIDPQSLRLPPMTVEHALGACVAGLTEIAGAGVSVLDGERVLAGFKAGLG